MNVASILTTIVAAALLLHVEGGTTCNTWSSSTNYGCAVGSTCMAKVKESGSVWKSIDYCVGSVSNGGVCSDHYDCAGASTLCSSSTCGAQYARGATCEETWECDGDNYCKTLLGSTKQCSRQKGIGESCTYTSDLGDDDECKSNYCNSDGECAEFLQDLADAIAGAFNTLITIVVVIGVLCTLCCVGGCVMFYKSQNKRKRVVVRPQPAPQRVEVSVQQPPMAQPMGVMGQPMAQPMMAQPMTQPMMAQPQPMMAQPQPMMSQPQPMMAQPMVNPIGPAYGQPMQPPVVQPSPMAQPMMMQPTPMV